MVSILNFAYKIYQLIVLLPVLVLVSVWASVTMEIVYRLGISTDRWSSFVSRWWARIIMKASLLPVEIKPAPTHSLKGGEDQPAQDSYRQECTPLPFRGGQGRGCIYVANHQGACDIFLICGYLGAEIRWMMKKELEKIPLVGIGCRRAGYIYVDKSSRAAIRDTYQQAERALQSGASIMVFPEGARTHDGKMQPFTRGAFTLADELQLPVVPLTINGSFDVLPRHRDGKFITWHPLSLTIHEPIYPLSKGQENIDRLRKLSYEAISSALRQ